MPLNSGLFDLKQLSDQVDAARAERNLSWVAISKEVGVAASTIRRFAHASDAEADGVLALIGWLGVTPEEFIGSSKVEGAELPPRGDGVIRVASSRTTIQRLVSAAQTSGVSVASLTRWSPV